MRKARSEGKEAYLSVDKLYIDKRLYRGIWLKFDKNFFHTDEDLYLAVAYFPPENSPFHDIYDNDIFQQLENDIVYFMDKGKVFLTGDLNSRIGQKTDYIEHDYDLQGDGNQPIDTPLPRCSRDFKSNRFGDYLLDLCKATNLRIVNGRLHEDKTVGKITCMTHNGESVVDYMLTSVSNFDYIDFFAVKEFNEFSNHAPLSFSLKIETHPQSKMNYKRTFYKWNPEYGEAFVNDIRTDIENLERSVHEGIENGSDVESLVTLITQYITNKGDKYFKQNVTVKTVEFASVDKNRQKWYNDEYKKKDYKYCCRKYKKEFNRQLSKKMNDMRRNSPRNFWKMFKKKTSSQPADNIELSEFFQHFQNLAQKDDVTENEECMEFLRQFDSNGINESTFSELDSQITKEEILKAVKSLSTNKASSFDNIIYEYFKSSIEVIGEPIRLLFNYILQQGKFPPSWSKGVVIPLYKKGDSSDPNNYRDYKKAYDLIDRNCLWKRASSPLAAVIHNFYAGFRMHFTISIYCCIKKQSIDSTWKWQLFPWMF
ncbi:uncharacterized protein LOC128548716 [Mercenaria mercenaria]|uniref:uncharacterized protein LOC128548716 n=1 Tax=Mercenaria mercenaria TaxID=6596 RepID=UPI00234E6C58|nr:uncharacterized protein LOC128548716 [Mercenaria mercenaria]